MNCAFHRPSVGSALKVGRFSWRLSYHGIAFLYTNFKLHSDESGKNKEPHLYAFDNPASSIGNSGASDGGHYLAKTEYTIWPNPDQNRIDQAGWNIKISKTGDEFNT